MWAGEGGVEDRGDSKRKCSGRKEGGGANRQEEIVVSSSTSPSSTPPQQPQPPLLVDLCLRPPARLLDKDRTEASGEAEEAASSSSGDLSQAVWDYSVKEVLLEMTNRKNGHSKLAPARWGIMKKEAEPMVIKVPKFVVEEKTGAFPRPTALVNPFPADGLQVNGSLQLQTSIKDWLNGKKGDPPSKEAGRDLNIPKVSKLPPRQRAPRNPNVKLMNSRKKALNAIVAQLAGNAQNSHSPSTSTQNVMDLPGNSASSDSVSFSSTHRLSGGEVSVTDVSPNLTVIDRLKRLGTVVEVEDQTDKDSLKLLEKMTKSVSSLPGNKVSRKTKSSPRLSNLTHGDPQNSVSSKNPYQLTVPSEKPIVTLTNVPSDQPVLPRSRPLPEQPPDVTLFAQSSPLSLPPVTITQSLGSQPSKIPTLPIKSLQVQIRSVQSKMPNTSVSTQVNQQSFPTSSQLPKDLPVLVSLVPKIQFARTKPINIKNSNKQKMPLTTNSQIVVPQPGPPLATSSPIQSLYISKDVTLIPKTLPETLQDRIQPSLLEPVIDIVEEENALDRDGLFIFKAEIFHNIDLPNDQKVFSCDICSAVYTSENLLKKHYLRLHVSRKYISPKDMEEFKIDPEPSPETNCDQLIFRCHTCKECFLSKNDLRSHLTDHPPVDELSKQSNKSLSIYKCENCSAAFKGRKTYGKHKKSCKLSPPPSVEKPELYHCLYCNETFMNANSKRNHILSYHPYVRKKHCCVFCKKDGFSTNVSLFLHLLNDHPTVYFACQNCKERFTDLEDLRVHVEKRHNQDEKIKSSLTGRISTINQEKIYYSCDNCQRKFLIEGSFKEHKCNPDKEEKPKLQKIKIKKKTYAVPEKVNRTVDLETLFFSRVSKNVRENLTHFMDGKLNKSDSSGDDNCEDQSAGVSRTFLNFSDGFPSSSEALSVSNGADTPSRAKAPWEKFTFPKNYDGRCGLTSYIKDTAYLDISTQLIMRRNLQRLNMLPIKESPSTDVPSAVDLERLGAECAESFGLIKKEKNDKGEEEVGESERDGALSGEWVRERMYVCSACQWETPCLWEMEDHKYLAHPRVHCPQHELIGKQSVLSQTIYKRLVEEEKPPYEGPMPPAGPPLADLSCTKCSKSGFSELTELHVHILECAGVVVEAVGPPPRKRRRRSRRRPRRGLKRNIPQTPQKIPPKQRTKPGDTDTIQRMIANLPAKRISRKVLTTFDENKARLNAKKKAAQAKGGKNKNKAQEDDQSSQSESTLSPIKELEKLPPINFHNLTLIRKQQDYIDTSAEGGDVLSSLRMMPVIRTPSLPLPSPSGVKLPSESIAISSPPPTSAEKEPAITLAEEQQPEEEEMPTLEIEKDISPVESPEIPVLSPVESSEKEGVEVPQENINSIDPATVASNENEKQEINTRKRKSIERPNLPVMKKTRRGKKNSLIDPPNLLSDPQVSGSSTIDVEPVASELAEPAPTKSTTRRSLRERNSLPNLKNNHSSNAISALDGKDSIESSLMNDKKLSDKEEVEIKNPSTELDFPLKKDNKKSASSDNDVPLSSNSESISDCIDSNGKTGKGVKKPKITCGEPIISESITNSTDSEPVRRKGRKPITENILEETESSKEIPNIASSTGESQEKQSSNKDAQKRKGSLNISDCENISAEASHMSSDLDRPSEPSPSYNFSTDNLPFTKSSSPQKRGRKVLKNPEKNSDVGSNGISISFNLENSTGQPTPDSRVDVLPRDPETRTTKKKGNTTSKSSKNTIKISSEMSDISPNDSTRAAATAGVDCFDKLVDQSEKDHFSSNQEGQGSSEDNDLAKSDLTSEEYQISPEKLIENVASSQKRVQERKSSLPVKGNKKRNSKNSSSIIYGDSASDAASPNSSEPDRVLDVSASENPEINTITLRLRGTRNSLKVAARASQEVSASVDLMEDKTKLPTNIKPRGRRSKRLEEANNGNFPENNSIRSVVDNTIKQLDDEIIDKVITENSSPELNKISNKENHKLIHDDTPEQSSTTHSIVSNIPDSSAEMESDVKLGDKNYRLTGLGNELVEKGEENTLVENTDSNIIHDNSSVNIEDSKNLKLPSLELGAAVEKKPKGKKASKPSKNQSPPAALFVEPESLNLSTERNEKPDSASLLDSNEDALDLCELEEPVKRGPGRPRGALTKKLSQIKETRRSKRKFFIKDSPTSQAALPRRSSRKSYNSDLSVLYDEILPCEEEETTGEVKRMERPRRKSRVVKDFQPPLDAETPPTTIIVQAEVHPEPVLKRKAVEADIIEDPSSSYHHSNDPITKKVKEDIDVIVSSKNESVTSLHLKGESLLDLNLPPEEPSNQICSSLSLENRSSVSENNSTQTTNTSEKIDRVSKMSDVLLSLDKSSEESVEIPPPLLNEFEVPDIDESQKMSPEMPQLVRSNDCLESTGKTIDSKASSKAQDKSEKPIKKFTVFQSKSNKDKDNINSSPSKVLDLNLSKALDIYEFDENEIESCPSIPNRTSSPLNRSREAPGSPSVTNRTSSPLNRSRESPGSPSVTNRTSSPLNRSRESPGSPSCPSIPNRTASPLNKSSNAPSSPIRTRSPLHRLRETSVTPTRTESPTNKSCKAPSSPSLPIRAASPLRGAEYTYKTNEVVDKESLVSTKAISSEDSSFTPSNNIVSIVDTTEPESTNKKPNSSMDNDHVVALKNELPAKKKKVEKKKYIDKPLKTSEDQVLDVTSQPESVSESYELPAASETYKENKKSKKFLKRESADEPEMKKPKRDTSDLSEGKKLKKVVKKKKIIKKVVKVLKKRHLSLAGEKQESSTKKAEEGKKVVSVAGFTWEVSEEEMPPTLESNNSDLPDSSVEDPLPVMKQEITDLEENEFPPYIWEALIPLRPENSVARAVGADASNQILLPPPPPPSSKPPTSSQPLHQQPQGSSHNPSSTLHTWEPAGPWDPATSDTSLGSILDSVNKLLNEPDSSFSPLGLPNYSLADLQKAMGVSDAEMAVLQQLGEASLQLSQEGSGNSSSRGDEDWNSEKNIIDLDSVPKEQSQPPEETPPHPPLSPPLLLQDMDLAPDPHSILFGNEDWRWRRRSTESPFSLLQAHQGKVVLCPACNSHFMGFPALQKHLAKAHPTLDAESKSKRNTGAPVPKTDMKRRTLAKGPRLVCFDCQLILSSEQMALHLEKEHDATPDQVSKCATLSGETIDGPAIGERLRSKMSLKLGDLLDKAVSNLLQAKHKPNNKLHGARELILKLQKQHEASSDASGEEPKVVKKLFSCGICGLKFSLPSSRNKHEVLAHRSYRPLVREIAEYEDDWREAPSPPPQEDSGQISINPQCSDCGLSFNTIQEMMRHRLEDHSARRASVDTVITSGTGCCPSPVPSGATDGSRSQPDSEGEVGGTDSDAGGGSAATTTTGGGGQAGAKKKSKGNKNRKHGLSRNGSQLVKERAEAALRELNRQQRLKERQRWEVKQHKATELYSLNEDST